MQTPLFSGSVVPNTPNESYPDCGARWRRQFAFVHEKMAVLDARLDVLLDELEGRAPCFSRSPSRSSSRELSASSSRMPPTRS
jgi:hypothetical protein